MRSRTRLRSPHLSARGVFRKLAQTDEEFIAVTQPMWDGLYQWCQDQLAQPGAAAGRAAREE